MTYALAAIYIWSGLTVAKSIALFREVGRSLDQNYDVNHPTTNLQLAAIVLIWPIVLPAWLLFETFEHR